MSKNSQDRTQTEAILRKMELRRLSALNLINSDELTLLEWYIEKNEHWLDRARAEEKAHIQSQRCSPDGVNESGLIAIGHFERRLRYSHVIYLASVLDSLLETACEQLVKIRGNQNLPFKHNELKGERYEAQIKFLRAYSSIEFPDELAQSIRDLNVMRKIIVRDNGKLEDPEKSELKVQRVAGIAIDDDRVEVGRLYIQAVTGAIRKTTERIEQGLRALVAVSLHPKALK